MYGFDIADILQEYCTGWAAGESNMKYGAHIFACS